MTRLLIIKHPNTYMAEIQTTDRLCEYRYSFSPPADEELDPKFIAFRDALTAIHGLKEIRVGRHDIHMERYEVFSFDELIPQVIDVLKAFTGSEYDVSVDDRSEEYERMRSERSGRASRYDDDYEYGENLNS